MQLLFSRRPWILVLGFMLICIIGGVLWSVYGTQKSLGETTNVIRKDVSVLVSVSGSIKTKNSTTLSFPKTGVIERIFVREGDVVKKGQVLASLGQAALISEYESALASLRRAEAGRDEEGAQGTTALKNAEANLERVTREQDELVEHARRTLLSTDLEATQADTTSDDTAPTISGTYTCAREGTYTLSIYRSGSESSYSYKLSGLDTGTYTAYTGSAAPFGTCGLSILFAENVPYRNDTWTIEIPNKRSSQHATNLNAYERAQTQRTIALETAREEVATAKTQTLQTNNAVTEAGQRAEADVREAAARVAVAEAKIADDTIRAPFDGIVSAVDISLGEVSVPGTGISMTAGDTYELKTRVPEIDITHLAIGDSAHASFDARPEEHIPATISFISPMPTEIDGVSYYDAFLTLNETPGWMRAGLNADVDITVETATNTLALPKRFIVHTGDTTNVLINTNGKATPVEITVGLIGNDGFVQVGGISEGTEVIAP